MKILRYGSTNTCFLEGGLLIDTDCAGKIQGFYRALKTQNLQLCDIRYVLATHYHPDHMGLIGTLMQQGVRLLLTEKQLCHVHDADYIYAREKCTGFVPVDESSADIISCADSRAFLRTLGIDGEIISTPSHSPDSISVILDSGICIVGDLEPLSYLAAYEDNAALQADWDRIRSFSPRRIIYAHANEQTL